MTARDHCLVIWCISQPGDLWAPSSLDPATCAARAGALANLHLRWCVCTGTGLGRVTVHINIYTHTICHPGWATAKREGGDTDSCSRTVDTPWTDWRLGGGRSSQTQAFFTIRTENNWLTFSILQPSPLLTHLLFTQVRARTRTETELLFKILFHHVHSPIYLRFPRYGIFV